jgi:hypothetical protein
MRPMRSSTQPTRSHSLTKRYCFFIYAMYAWIDAQLSEYSAICRTVFFNFQKRYICTPLNGLFQPIHSSSWLTRSHVSSTAYDFGLCGLNARIKAHLKKLSVLAEPCFFNFQIC